jgi:5-methylthioadenosine/S-adenosylhomocysteine deaminase
MSDQCHSSNPTMASTPDVGCDNPGTSPGEGTSRRELLKAGAALMAGGVAVEMRPGAALAQGAGAADGELARVQGQRRILLKGGIVLTLDRQVGDFAQADVLMEGGKIQEVRPNIAVSGDATAVVDASNRIVIPGFIDTHSHSYQGLLRSTLPSGIVDPDYNRDIQNNLTPAYQAADA